MFVVGRVPSRISLPFSLAFQDDVATVKDFSALEMKPIPKPEMDVIRGRRLFLLRNLSRVRRREEEENRKSGGESLF